MTTFLMRLLILSLACSLMAAEESQAPKPTISEKARGDFWKASLAAAQADAEKAHANAQKLAAVQAMQKECGDWKLEMDQQAQEPVCIEPPRPAKPEAK